MEQATKTSSNTSEILESRIGRLEYQNEVAKKNLENLYLYFDKASFTNRDKYKPLWNKALKLKSASDALFLELQDLKQQSDPNQFTTPLEMTIKLKEFQNLIIGLPDSVPVDTSELTLIFKATPSQTWSQDSIIMATDMTLIQNTIVNAESYAIMKLYHNLKSEQEKEKNGS